MIPSATLISEARAFYDALAANNKKAWWDENRGTYDNVLKPGALSILAELSDPLAALTDTKVKTKLFRPNRDVRFSKDKTPYKTHLHMLWVLEGPGHQNPVFFFGIGRDYVRAGAGMMGFEKPMLEDWRKFVDLDTKRITGIVDSVTAKGYSMSDPELKRIPPAYDKDHPAGELLRRKGLIVRGDIPADAKDLPAAIMAAFTDLWPINGLLTQIAES